MTSAVEDVPAVVVKWGIIGSGHISNAFCLSLLRLNSPRHQIVAVASRLSIERAQEFARKCRLLRFYGTYEELFADNEINAIYVGNLTCDHAAASLAAIEAGKAVLVEKPMTMTPDESRRIIEASRRHGVLAVEGLWSRFMPPFERIRQLLKEGNKPLSMSVSFIVPFYRIDRITRPEMGGGIFRDVGIYAAQLATMLFGGVAPTRITATGLANEHGVDIADSVSLTYENCGGLASILVDSRGGGRELIEASVFFAPGSEFKSVRLCPPFYVTDRLELTRSCDGSVQVENYPIYPDLPQPPEGLAFHHAASQALAYEAEAFADIFQEWIKTRDSSNPVIEHPLRTHAETLIDAEIIAAATGQWLNKDNK